MRAASVPPPDLRAWLQAFVFEARFLTRYPYYAHVLAALEPVLDTSVPWLGISLHRASGRGLSYYLHVNVPALTREPQYLRGILLHEVHHIVLGHAAHPKFFGTAQPDLMQIAQEVSANEHIEEALPEPMLWQHFERFGLRAGQSTWERYEKLCAARAEGQEPKVARDTKQVDEHSWRELPEPAPGALHETRQLLDATEQRAREDAERAAVPHRRIAGQTPAQLLAQLGGTSGPPELAIDWREALRMFVARVRAPVHTWARPSRRFPGRVGELPGRTYRPRPLLRPRLIVAIDTSLSMSERELTEIARQLRPMSELAQLQIVECDRAIARSYPFQGSLDTVQGRGGTDLRPVFAESVLGGLRADGVVYFTDGQGPYPERPPPVPVLWLLTKPSEFACPWGTRGTLDLGRTKRSLRS